MPICPQCRATGAAVLLPCPNCAGVYLVDEASWNLHRANPHLGRAVDGRFVVTGELGAGSMAQVYEAVQLGVDRPVALKVFREDDVASTEARQRFMQEARVLGKLAHPNNVTMYDFGSDARLRLLYIAMERLAGQSLRRAMQRGLTDAAIVKVVAQVALALAEAHGLGIVHRDLKPENIIVSFAVGDEPTVKVVDFGIAKLLDHYEGDRTSAGALFGTPAYMSPEQCRGDVEQIGPHSDVYALGCVLFEMLTGRLPYVTSVPQEMLQHHIHAPVPQIVPRPGLQPSTALLALTTRCMQKEPHYRPRTSELVASLQAIVGAAPGGPAGQSNGALRIVVPENQIDGVELQPPVPSGHPLPTAVREVEGLSVLDTYPGKRGSAEPTGGIDQSRVMAAARSTSPSVIVLMFILIVVVGGLFIIAALFAM